jgi:hypothetical protein
MGMKEEQTRATIPKHARGRTAIESTPITTRSRVPLSADARRRIEQRLRRALAPFGPRIERASIRFEDLNGPRHGLGLRCAIKVVFSGSDSIIIDQRATSVLESVRRAMPRVARSVRRFTDQSGHRTPRATHPRRAGSRRSPPAATTSRATDDGSLIGNRVGRGPANWAAVLERPEKQQRDAEVDTAEPGVSATDRKAGGKSTARRNSKRNDSGMTVALEDSRGKPSRKSTRGGKNRAKAASQLTRRTQRQLRSPTARAARGG